MHWKMPNLNTAEWNFRSHLASLMPKLIYWHIYSRKIITVVIIDCEIHVKQYERSENVHKHSIYRPVFGKSASTFSIWLKYIAMKTGTEIWLQQRQGLIFMENF